MIECSKCKRVREEKFLSFTKDKWKGGKRWRCKAKKVCTGKADPQRKAGKRKKRKRNR